MSREPQSDRIRIRPFKEMMVFLHNCFVCGHECTDLECKHGCPLPPGITLTYKVGSREPQ